MPALARTCALAASLLALFACQRARTEPQAAPSTVAPAPAPPAVTSRLDAALRLPALASGQKAPLLIMLHGLGSSGDQLEAGSDWLAFATSHGIAWLAPSGPLDSRGRRFWNAGPSCCDFDHTSVNHVAALAELIERTASSAPIDRARVFVGGHSNGGFMAHRLACERPDLVRGIVAVAGTGPVDRAACRKPGDLRVLQIHGDADPIVTYGGGHLFDNPSLPEHVSALKTAQDWAAALGCSSTPVALPALDLEATLPGAETKLQSYPSCPSGKVELWTVSGGQHAVAFRAPAPAAVWAFLSQ